MLYFVGKDAGALFPSFLLFTLSDWYATPPSLHSLPPLLCSIVSKLFVEFLTFWILSFMGRAVYILQKREGAMSFFPTGFAKNRLKGQAEDTIHHSTSAGFGSFLCV